MNLQFILKNKFLLSTTAFGTLLLAVLVLVALPAFSEIRLINTQVYEERVRLEKLYLRGQLQKKVRANYAKIKDEIPFLDDIILKENQELQYITALEQAASEANIDLKINIGASKRLPNQLFSTLSLNFELNGSWTNILRWLARLEAIPYYTDIKEIAVAVHEQKENGPAMATCTIAADTFWLLP
ncbi:MAG: hypothetical protein Q8L21_02940 [Candidatus Komeilibacteria bacterium]|nr:hypothetical protein [Candidatus Komeilibacteria bacterium]